MERAPRLICSGSRPLRALSLITKRLETENPRFNEFRKSFCTILPGICNSRRGSYNVRNYWILFVNLNNYTFPIKMPRLDISDPADILLSRHHSILLFSRRHHLNGVCSFDFHLRVYAICSRILYSYFAEDREVFDLHVEII